MPWSCTATRHEGGDISWKYKLVSGPSRHSLAVDLQDLIAKADTSQRGRAVLPDKGHKDALVDGLDGDAHLAVLVLAEHNFAHAVLDLGAGQGLVVGGCDGRNGLGVLRHLGGHLLYGVRSEELTSCIGTN